MPAAFDKCRKAGGRIRTKKLSGGRYLHICFIGGKSYAGEIKTKENFEGGEDYMKKIDGAFNENLSFNILEGSMDEGKRTVEVCALAPCLSRNDRYYSHKIVESVRGTLIGKKSFADHDERDTKNLIGKIVGESFRGGKAYAKIKVSNAKGIAGQTWDKIKDGTIDSVSIAANGKAKPVEMEGRVVAEVTELDVRSVDFVTESGIDDAKVVRVFESSDVPKVTEVKEKVTIENIEGLKKEYPKLVEQLTKDLDTKLTEATEKATKAEDELADMKVAGFKEAEIVKLETTDEVKTILRDKVTGKTNEEVSISVKKEFTDMKSANEAFKTEAKVKGVQDSTKHKDTKTKDTDAWTSQRIREDEKIPENLKGKAIERLWQEGSKAMIAFLKDSGIEL